MFICDKDEHCIDCPKNYPDEQCEHWVEVDYVVHGHWEHDEAGANFCSVCDMYPYDDGEYHLVWHTDYCPHCGTKMDERFCEVWKKVDEVSE